MADKYIAEVKVTKVEFAGDHDRETVVVWLSKEAERSEAALKSVVAAVQEHVDIGFRTS